MLEQLQHIIKTESKYYVVGATSTSSGILYYVMLVKSVKDELLIAERFDITSFKDLKKDIPVVLHMDGDGIINKQTTKEAGYRNSLVFGGG